MSKPKSNKMGVVQLTILTMVNMMGSGIIMLPTKLSEVGTISIISWLVTAVGSMALAWRLRNAVCLAVNPAVWAVTPNMPSVNPATLWRTIPTASRC